MDIGCVTGRASAQYNNLLQQSHKVFDWELA